MEEFERLHTKRQNQLEKQQCSAIEKIMADQFKSSKRLACSQASCERCFEILQSWSIVALANKKLNLFFTSDKFMIFLQRPAVHLYQPGLLQCNCPPHHRLLPRTALGNMTRWPPTSDNCRAEPWVPRWTTTTSQTPTAIRQVGFIINIITVCLKHNINAFDKFNWFVNCVFYNLDRLFCLVLFNNIIIDRDRLSIPDWIRWCYRFFTNVSSILQNRHYYLLNYAFADYKNFQQSNYLLR